jgi:hypothetical protein
MTNPENLGRQFDDYIPVFRGIAGTTPASALKRKSVGKHWTTSRSVADKFSDKTSEVTSGHNRNGGETWQGTVLTGYVHPNDVLKPGTSEYDEMVRSRGMRVGSEGEASASGAVDENELPIRDGATVHVVQAIHYKYGKGRGKESRYQNFFDNPIPKVI